MRIEHGNQVADVQFLVVRRRQKVEDGAIMPNVTRRYGPIGGHVGLNPGGNVGCRFKALSCPLKGRA